MISPYSLGLPVGPVGSGLAYAKLYPFAMSRNDIPKILDIRLAFPVLMEVVSRPVM
jgi:hypothetical protein